MDESQASPGGATATANTPLAVRGDNIVKRFGAVTALDGVSLTLGRG